jgi:hypothetical protein
MPWMLYLLGKCPWYPFDRRLRAPTASLPAVAKRKKSLPLLRIKPQSYSPYLNHNDNLVCGRLKTILYFKQFTEAVSTSTK